MFGYLVVNPTQLSVQDRKLYRSFYCGLCHRLAGDYGTEGRRTLSYDLTFVNIVLNSVSTAEEIHASERCPLHSLRPHDFISTETDGFAAAMNLLLYYYKCLDDYRDENRKSAFRKAEKLLSHVESIRKEFPQQTAVIEGQLAALGEYELHNELNPDLPANCFGLLMARLFEIDGLPQPEDLKAFGYHLGRFIYLMDACMDFRYDIKHQLYNPLTATSMSDRRGLLESVMADTMAEYEKLPVTKYRSIIENVLYSGIWTRYSLKFKEN